MEPTDWIIVGVFAALIVIGVAALFGAAFGTEPEDKNVFMQETMQGALEELTSQLPAEDEFVLVAFMPLKGDPKQEVTRAVARHLRSLDDGRRFRGPDGDYVAAEVARDLAEGESLVTTEDQALKIARHVGVQAVLFGEGRMDDGPDASEVLLKLTYVKAPQQRPNPREKYTQALGVERRLTKSILSLDYYRLRMGETSVFLRVILWFLIAAGLPFAFYPLELKVFSFESNVASMAVLGGLTAVDLIAALLFNGFALSGVWIILYLALVGTGGFYNFAMLNALQESS